MVETLKILEFGTTNIYKSLRWRREITSVTMSLGPTFPPGGRLTPRLFRTSPDVPSGPMVVLTGFQLSSAPIVPLGSSGLGRNQVAYVHLYSM